MSGNINGKLWYVQTVLKLALLEFSKFTRQCRDTFEEQHFRVNLQIKQFQKSLYIYQSYEYKLLALFFYWDTVHISTTYTVKFVQQLREQYNV